MTPEERKATHKMALILRSIRKSMPLTQSELASKLGMTQSALSKIEKGTLMPSAYVWISLCQLADVPADAFFWGQIDREKNCRFLKKDDRQQGYKIPKKYNYLMGTSVRAMLPNIAYFKELFGEQGFQDFCFEHKIDPDFFAILDNYPPLFYSRYK